MFNINKKNIISEGPDWKSAPKPKGVAVLRLGNERKVYIPGIGWQFPKTARDWAKKQGFENWQDIPNPSQPPKPKLDIKPKTEPVLSKKRGVEGIGVGKDFKEKSWSSAEKQRYASTAPPPPPPPLTPRLRQQAPAPAPRQQAPAPASVERRVSTVTGKPAYVGTTSSGQKFERRAATSAELKAAQAARQSALTAGKTRPEAEKAAVTAGITASKTQKEEKMDAFDLVLEYLISEGHTDTLDEALYVMMEMDPETIQSICEAKKPKKWIQKAIKHPGALSKELGVPEEENIPAGKLKKAAKAKGTLGKRARLAMTLKGLNKE